MAKLTITNEADIREDAGLRFGSAATGVNWSKLLSPPDYSLRMTVAEIGSGGHVQWDARHGEEGVYVLSGEVEVEGRPCESGCAAILESGSEVRLEAKTTAKLALFGRTRDTDDEPAKTPEGDGLHIVGPRGWFRCEHAEFEGVVSTWFADSTCSTCKLTLMRVQHPHGFAGPAHSHSQDEIIYVLDGSVRMGKHEYGPGSALCIPADIRYRLSYPAGGDFLNYRPGVSFTTVAGSSTSKREGGLAGGGVLVGDFR